MTQPIPESYNLKVIPVPMPPMLPKALSFPENSRYIKLTYEATNCWVDYGCGGHSDNFWVYSAMVDHLALKYYLDDRDLGTDDSFPTHALLVDTENAKLYVGQYDDVVKFLKDYLVFLNPTPPVEITPQERERMLEAIKNAFEQHNAKMNAMPSEELGNMVQQRIADSYQHIQDITRCLNNYVASLAQNN